MACGAPYSSHGSGNYVEVANHDGAVFVRDSKRREAGHLTATVDARRSFVSDIKTRRLI